MCPPTPCGREMKKEKESPSWLRTTPKIAAALTKISRPSVNLPVPCHIHRHPAQHNLSTTQEHHTSAAVLSPYCACNTFAERCLWYFRAMPRERGETSVLRGALQTLVRWVRSVCLIVRAPVQVSWRRIGLVNPSAFQSMDKILLNSGSAEGGAKVGTEIMRRDWKENPPRRVVQDPACARPGRAPVPGIILVEVKIIGIVQYERGRPAPVRRNGLASCAFGW